MSCSTIKRLQCTIPPTRAHATGECARRCPVKQLFHANCKTGKPRKTCKCALCTVDDASCFLTIRLGPKTSECEKHVSVKFSVTGCDVTYYATTLQGFNKHKSRHDSKQLDNSERNQSDPGTRASATSSGAASAAVPHVPDVRTIARFSKCSIN